MKYFLKLTIGAPKIFCQLKACQLLALLSWMKMLIYCVEKKKKPAFKTIHINLIPVGGVKKIILFDKNNVLYTVVNIYTL